MPTAYTQAGRPLQLTTPLGVDALLAVGLHGRDGLSEPFRYTVDAVAPAGTAVAFDRLLGQPACVRMALPKGRERFFHGVCARVTQAESDGELTAYHLDLVPALWLLTKSARSRLFQHQTVKDILGEVFTGMAVEWKLTGRYEPRNFCAQYRETDFQFASRLMEEDGLFYFFTHTAQKHTLVVADHPQAHPPVPGEGTVYFQSPAHDLVTDEDHVHEMGKRQDQATGTFTLWDHSFELPHQHLDAAKKLTASAAVGQASHKLTTGPADRLEVYDWPGEYAQRFDRVDRDGGDRPDELQKVRSDAARTVALRAEAEAAAAVRVTGAGSARQFAGGHKVRVAVRPDDKPTGPLRAAGEYVLTGVAHAARMAGAYRASGADAFGYTNTFTAIPAGVPFRPPRVTPKPVVPGPQTAVVVGPPGQEVATDKYGRVKVQFHWDRAGTHDAGSSCWVRVGTPWAGVNWGGLWLPRVGQEVVVAFLNGDPDCPLVVGGVYNDHQMPAYPLPDHHTKSYLRSNSTPGGDGYNELRFDDKAGNEQVYLHAQRQLDERVREDRLEYVGKSQHVRVGFYLPDEHKGTVGAGEKEGSRYEEVAVDHHLKVHRHVEEQYGGNLKLLVGGGDGDGNADVHVKGYRRETVDKAADLHVTGKMTVAADQGYDLTAGTDLRAKSGTAVAVTAGTEIHLKANTTVVIEAPAVCLKGAGGFVLVSAAGVAISGTMVLINSGGAAVPGSGTAPGSPKDAADAKPKKPDDADHATTGSKSNVPPSLPG